MSLYPLAGTHVVDATTGIAGPLCAKLLADAGAAVTKLVLPSDGASTAAVPAGWSAFLDRDKRLLEVDPGTTKSWAAVEDLLSDAALYLTSSRHDEIAPLGLDCPTVLERHRDLLAACVTPFGEQGPYAKYLSDDLVMSALSGLADCTPGFPDRQEQEGEPPVQSLAPLAEFGAGVVAGVAVLGALFRRLRGAEEPRHVEISAHEANVWLMVSEWGIAAYGGSAPGRTRKSRSLEPNCYLPCRDGYVVVVATTDKHWGALVEAMGRPDWALDERFADVEGRAANAAALHANLRCWAENTDGLEFMEAAQSRGVPGTCFFELRETVASEHVRIVGAVEKAAGVTVPADPICVDGSRRRRRAAFGTATFREGPWPEGDAPLAGVRVLDLGQMVAGPMAGQHLAALGADVIVVESRARLTSRQFGPFAGEPEYEASSNFNHCNRGKASVAIDLTTTEGRSVFRRLVKVSDVVLENFSKRAATRLGVTYPDLVQVRGDVILASISAFGRTGPWGDYVSHHGGVTALSGLASVIQDEEGNPRLVGGIYPDVLTGAYTALAIVQAVAHREQTGRGCRVEVSMLDVLLNCMGGLVPDAADGAQFRPHPGRILNVAEPNRFLAVAAEDCERHGSLVAEASGRSRSVAMATLQAAGLRAASVMDMLEVMNDPHLRECGFVLELDHPVAGRKPLAGVPWLYDGGRPHLGVAPLLGEHTEERLAGVGGLEADRLAELQRVGVLR